MVEVMATEYWQKLSLGDGSYECPWCKRSLKLKLSNSAKNPGKSFLSCAKDFGGCGLFSFFDAVPDERFNPNKPRDNGNQKRAKVGWGQQPQGLNIVGNVANTPSATDQRLAELATKVSELSTKISDLEKLIIGVDTYLKQ